MHLKFVLAPSLQLLSFMFSGKLSLDAKNTAFCAYCIITYMYKANLVVVGTFEVVMHACHLILVSVIHALVLDCSLPFNAMHSMS